jgi:hypothetical protein
LAVDREKKSGELHSGKGGFPQIKVRAAGRRKKSIK